jgi:flagellin
MTNGINRGSLEELMAQRYASLARLGLAQSQRRLATGRRINHASDDPAGLMASQQLESTLAALDAETRGAERAASQATVADGALQQVSDLLTEANGLLVANADGTLSAGEKQANQLQLDSIFSSIDRLAGSTEFAGVKLLDGTASLQAAGQTLEITPVRTSALGELEVDGNTYHLSDLRSGLPLDTTAGNVAIAQQVLKAAQTDIGTLRQQIGSFQATTVAPRLNAIASAFENLAAANSQISDTDTAAETSRMVRCRILESSSTWVLGQAGRSRTNILSLLRTAGQTVTGD